jgi:hypothetical protein
MPITGGCLCGAVRFSVEPPTLFCCHCHCSWCRRAHGAAFVTWFGAREGAFTVTGDALRWHRSSEQSERGFCATCGTKMFFRSTLAPGEVHVALGCADDTGLTPLPTPSLHVFAEARAPWLNMKDDLPTFDRDHAALRKYQAIDRAPTAP